MDDSALTRQRKSRSNRAVLSGVGLMTAALLLSSWELAPLLATTLGAIIGFSLLMYGVHVGWLVFYDRESDGPAS
ncbi:MAG TPA: hypothetical protein VIT20_09770 [Propionibacteriaceae bacterium]